MAVIRIVVGAFTGTTIMTLFSYYLSHKLGRQFKEPDLLNRLILRSGIAYIPAKATPAAGWIIHYAVGTAFLILFHLVWQFTPADPVLVHGMIMGFFSGFIGIAGWKWLFRLRDHPPPVNLQEYFIQLPAAHVVFGVGAVIGYTLFPL